MRLWAVAKIYETNAADTPHELDFVWAMNADHAIAIAEGPDEATILAKPWRRATTLGPPPPDKQLNDVDAMDLIADFLNQPGPWNGGDVCDYVASVVERTGREILDNADEVGE